MRRTTKPFLGWGALAGLLAFMLLFGTTDTAFAGTFKPTVSAELADKTPETPSDLSFSFHVPKGDYNFAGFLGFVPKDWGIVRGETIPVNTVVGNLKAEATLGIANNPCNATLKPEFKFLNGTLDKSKTVYFDDTDNPDDVDSPAKDMDSRPDDPQDPGFGRGDYQDDEELNRVQDSIERWPEWIDRTIGDQKPIRRAIAITPVAGVAVILQLLVFEPGTKFEFESTDFQKLIPNDPELGFPLVVLLQNIGDPKISPEPSPITDFCTPLDSTSITFSSNFDADNDGDSNEDDTCPYKARDFSGDYDEDFDFLDNACDPDDSADTGNNTDEDDDKIDNEFDNCPLDANPPADVNAPADTPAGTQDDADGDGIGDACDKDKDKADGGQQLFVNPKEGTYKFTFFTVGQRDADGDGWQNSLDTCPKDVNVGDPTLATSGDPDQDGLDSVCDPDSSAETGTNSDQDGDGYPNRQDNCPLLANGLANREDPDSGNQKDDDFDQIGNACDETRDEPDGDLIPETLTADIVVGNGTGTGGPPSAAACPDCWRKGETPGTDTPAPDGSDTPGPTDPPTKGDGGSNTGVIVGAAVVAAIIIIGGGGFLAMRRRSGA